MEQIQKAAIRNILIVIAISTVLIIAFSLSFGMIPPLGNFLFPGNGVWKVPEDVVEHEVISVSSLSADVTIYRDHWGVPHIYGSNEFDISFALGYVHAQDRLIQMDMARRATRGKLSEILGSSMIETDKFNLNMMKDYWSVEHLKELKNSNDLEVQNVYNLLLSYTDGVNYYIDNCKALPLEFQFLSFEPDPWTPEDTLCFVKYMSEMLTWSYSDFRNLLIQDALGEAGYSELFGLPLSYQIPICPNYGEFPDISVSPSELSSQSSELQGASVINPELSALCANFLKGIESIPGEKQRIENRKVLGSNNWVVNGSKTRSGKPILCNDMHLDLNLPGIWYEAHLVDQSPGSDFNVYGFFLAGVPLAIVGHNAYVGWGFTNTAYDVIDWYYYNGINETHYWYKDVPTPYEPLDYEIPVKGQSPVSYTIKSTVHGPVFSDLFDEEDLPEELSDKVIACKWIAQGITHEPQALLGYSHATNIAEFSAASENFGTPAQNHIYADIYGNIAIRPTGKVPIRDDSGIPSWHLGNGSMPYNGSAGHGEWIGYVPFADLPHSENPEQCYLTSSNQLVAGPEYLKNYSLQNPLSIDAGYRARRINSLLASHNDITINDMKRFQHDVYSIKASSFTPYLLDVLNGLPSKTALQQAAYDLLTDWDFIMDKDEVAPSIFNLWLKIFHEETFLDEFTALESPSFPDHPILEKLTKTDENSVWFDNITTPVIEDRDDIILLAFEKALSALEIFFQTDNVAEWTWGEIHFARFPHLTGLSALGAGPYPVNGTGDTVYPFSASIWDDGEVRKSYAASGASERLIIDFANLNNSLSVIASGQRGVSTSKHYTDQLALYLNEGYHVQYFSADSPEKFQDAWIESTIIFKAGGT